MVERGAVPSTHLLSTPSTSCSRRLHGRNHSDVRETAKFGDRLDYEYKTSFRLANPFSPPFHLSFHFSSQQTPSNFLTAIVARKSYRARGRSPNTHYKPRTKSATRKLELQQWRTNTQRHLLMRRRLPRKSKTNLRRPARIALPRR